MFINIIMQKNYFKFPYHYFTKMAIAHFGTHQVSHNITFNNKQYQKQDHNKRTVRQHNCIDKNNARIMSSSQQQMLEYISGYFIISNKQHGEFKSSYWSNKRSEPDCSLGLCHKGVQKWTIGQHVFCGILQMHSSEFEIQFYE